MKKLYADVGACRALVANGNPSVRSLQASTLRDMGVGQVVQAARVEEAQRALENGTFDIVLCDYHFDSSSMTGQDLLDELRRNHVLPYSTVFIMVTAEASYAMVAEAAESALDSYLLKPHTAVALEERMLQARHRKNVLKSMFDAIESADLPRAAAIGQARFEARGEYWLTAGRIAAELQLRMGHGPAARAIYDAALATRPIPWATLGIARTHVEAAQWSKAGEVLEALIGEKPDYSDAWDLLARVQFEQGQLEAALETCRGALRLTPQSVSRLQRLGMIAFLLSSDDEALQALDRAVRLGLGSKMFDCQSMMLLAMLQFDKHDSKALGRTIDTLAARAKREPDNARLRRFAETTWVFRELSQRALEASVTRIEKLATEVREEGFDFEAASNLLALLVRVSRTEVRIPEMPAWIDMLAQRFCVSKTSADLLCHALQHQEPFAALIRGGQAQVGSAAEAAMAYSVQGSHTAAVKSLVLKSTETLNTKLIDLAGMVLSRHADKIDDSGSFTAKIDDLRQRYCTGRAQASLGAAAGRTAGGLNIRT